MSAEILFYGHKQFAYFCSNFYPAEFILDGKRWSTSEHYFQAMKFMDPKLQERVRKANRPNEAARIGRDRSLPLRKDWESVKERIMMRALEAKFAQNPDIKAELLATGDAKLIEDSPVDDYWGRGRDHKGKNRLGVLLMELRDKLAIDCVLTSNHIL